MRAGDVVDHLREAGRAHRGVLEFGGAGEARRVERSGQAAGDGDVAVGAQVGDEELQQRRFERPLQIDVEPLGAGRAPRSRRR